MPKLLHVVRSLRAETGGLAETVRNLAAAQRKRGDRVMIASLDPADQGDDDILTLGQRSHGYGFSPQFAPWLKAHSDEFDAVVVHGLWQYQGLGTWRALRGAKTPYFVFCHGMLDPWFKRTYPLKHLKKWIYWPWAEYRVLRDAERVCFTADEERRAARESFWLYRVREAVIPIGIPTPSGNPATQRAAFAAVCPGLRGRPYLLFLGRVHPKKGIDLLLQAFAQSTPTEAETALVIAGPCGDEGYLRALQHHAEQLGIADRVVWVPLVTGEAKWGALHGCEAFALISHQENFGVAVVEALACGKPVLISDRINICREIADDGAGLVGSDTAAGASELLTRWAALSPSARLAMGDAARRCFARRFEIGSVAEHLGRVMAEVIPAR